VKNFNQDIEQVIAKAIKEGVEKFYLPSIDHNETDAMLLLEKKVPWSMYCNDGLASMLC
jgi:TatD DNase family protein